MRRFPAVPGYYLPSFIEDGDPTEDEGASRSSIASPVGYKSYGPQGALEQWWNDIPNKVIPRRRLTASDLESIGED